MAKKRGVRKSTTRNSSAEGGDALIDTSLLARTQLYKRVPIAVRCRIDETILLKPSGCPSLEAIADEFELAERYGVSLSALKTYARKLEQCVRPMVTSQLMAGVLGCLPDGFRGQLLAGSEVLLLSRVIKALSDANAEEGESLSVADLAKLASILSAVAGKASNAARTSRKKPAKKKRGRQGGGSIDDDVIPSDETQLAETIRSIYGVTLTSSSS